MKLIDENVEEYHNLVSPENLKKEISITKEIEELVIKTRESIKNILEGTDKRKIIIVGPCSIHNSNEAEEYANKLKIISDKVKDKFLIIMRTYFEKPRTTVGWKGMIYDPFMDGSDNLELGLYLSREVLVKVSSLGIPCATEFLGTLIPQYFDDLITWAAIGARTTESQPHRELVSGLSMPAGFKNSTFGNIDIACNAMKSALSSHTFLGIDQKGVSSIIKTKGNREAHIILRGGEKPNYDSESVNEIIAKLKELELTQKIIIDCSHGNSDKDFRKQELAFKDIINQIKEGNEDIVGFMLESNINEGNQKLCENISDLKPGVSITDECISLETTEKIILDAYEKLNF